MPGRRLHQGRRHRRPQHLRRARQVRRRELRAQARGRRLREHGEFGRRHQRLTVLSVHREDRLAGRGARRLWAGGRGHGRAQADGGERLFVCRFEDGNGALSNYIF